MNNIKEVHKVISISTAVATFLLNTCRVLNGIDLCKECLIFLDNKALKKETEIFKLLRINIYMTLFKGYTSIYDHASAIKYGEKHQDIVHGIDELRFGESVMAMRLAFQYGRQGKYKRAEELYKKAAAIKIETGDRDGEATCYGHLGPLFRSLGEYAKANKYLEKALAIRKEIGDKQGEAQCYGNLGMLFLSMGEYVKAKEYLKKALLTRKQFKIGERIGEAAECAKLAKVLVSLGEYANAEEYLQKALAINIEIGSKEVEAMCCEGLGRLFELIGQFDKAKTYFEKALVIHREISHRAGEAANYGSLGRVFHCLRENARAEEYHRKALEIRKEIGDKAGMASEYGNLGIVLTHLGEHAKPIEYLEKALSITKEIGCREEEASCYGNLAYVYIAFGGYAKAKEYLEKALVITKEIGDNEGEFQWHLSLTEVMLSEGNIQQAFSNLVSGIQNCENMRCSLRDNDHFKISFLDKHVFPYQMLSALFCNTGNPGKALYVAELGRARALADLMSAQYFVGKQVSMDPQSWVGIERIMEKERNCTCLYISYFQQDILSWILKANKPILFRRIDVNEHDSVNQGLTQDLDEFFEREPFRNFHVLPCEQCEDRSLFPFRNSSNAALQSQEDRRLAALRLVEEEEEDQDQETQPSLALYYKMLISPVAELLDEPEIIIVPDRSLYKVPFAALKDESGKYLSESFRIRIVPSLTTLKLIQDRPADQCSETGALIVGDPDVTHVIHLSQLPCARKEAKMIGELLGVRPLLGHQASKLAVLDTIHSASLIHLAAHGDAERGEIALAPERPTNRILQQEDYLLTMSDIAQIQLRAKLVVLSCCHSGRGHIRSEGVVGIARAFLGSGARSVLVALWAIEDKATEQFMSRFYEHLVRGESASESLHQAMKWMRSNGYSDVRQWAPFVLIGDNVTIDFGN